MKPVKGINLGSWLLMEGYILGGRNIGETIFKKKFARIYGKEELKKFENAFRKNFIQEKDFKNISRMKAKYVRLPFNAKLIEPKPYNYCPQGTGIIRKALGWAQKYKLKVILDLHAAPGSQNCDWHADSAGGARFWQKKYYRHRAVAIWKYLSCRFGSHPGLGGYDLLNEPVSAKSETAKIKDFYQKAVKVIRKNDSKNTIFLEGNHWAQQIDFLKGLACGANIQVSIHTYQPLSFVYNFTAYKKYPGRLENKLWNKKMLYKHLHPYFEFSQKNNVSVFAGELGINWRGGYWGEAEYLDDLLSVLDDYGFGYTYWTYKAVANSVFPDGLIQYTGNNHCIRREGPVYGWENYLIYWKKEKAAIKNFWQTKNFTPNKKLLEILKTHFRKS